VFDLEHFALHEDFEHLLFCFRVWLLQVLSQKAVAVKAESQGEGCRARDL